MNPYPVIIIDAGFLSNVNEGVKLSANGALKDDKVAVHADVNWFPLLMLSSMQSGYGSKIL
jgi:hypothetical protein